MLKNIGKSIVWLVGYFAISTVSTIIMSVIGIFTSGIFQGDMAQKDINSLIVDVVTKMAVPGLILTGIITIISFCIYKKIRKSPLDIKKINFQRAFFCIGLGMLLNCVITYLLEVVMKCLPQSLIDSANNSTNIATNSNSIWILLLGTGLLVPITEEIYFRYGIHRTLAKSNIWVAYVVSSVVFGIVHGNVIQGAYAAILGVVFAYLYTKGENLWYSILIHTAINTTSVIVAAISDKYDDYVMIGIGIIGLIITVSMILFSKEVKTLFVAKNETTEKLVTE